MVKSREGVWKTDRPMGAKNVTKKEKRISGEVLISKLVEIF